MFAIVPAGKAVRLGYVSDTNSVLFQPVQFAQVGETEFLAEIPTANLNHIVVFMTGVTAFPVDLGGSVYIRWPSPQSEANWHLLGGIWNDKPSAIFKVAQLHASDAPLSSVFGGSAFSNASSDVAQVGIMVEPLSQIVDKTSAEGTSASQQSSMVEFANKMVRNLVNHAESYTVRMQRPDLNGFADYIPTSALQEWYNSFSRRFQQNPYFWRALRDS